jgi:hypothetical protein
MNEGDEIYNMQYIYDISTVYEVLLTRITQFFRKVILKMNYMHEL